MKIVVLGDGLLGSEIVQQTGWDFISRKKDGIDAKNPTSVFEKIKGYDVVVNCIAHTDTYSKDKEPHWDINVKFLSELIDVTNTDNQKLIHISTDYLYANSVENASEEDVPVHLRTWYGYTKLLGDGLVQLKSNNYLVCRLSHKPNPFPYENAWIDIKTNGDFVDKIAELVIKLINSGSSGVYNVGTKTKSIYEMASKTKSVSASYRPTSVPFDTTMDLTKLNKLI